jgi:hypothetical protein
LSIKGHAVCGVGEQAIQTLLLNFFDFVWAAVRQAQKFPVMALQTRA